MDINRALEAEDMVILLCQLPLVLNTVVPGFRNALRRRRHREKRLQVPLTHFMATLN
jgi:hypothetical protein